MEKAKIYIVEDESIVALDLKCNLEAIGYQISGISSKGEDAIEKIALCKPDLILMDIGLEGEMDGIDACNIIKEKYNIPVVFLTANSDESTLHRAKITDPFGYILKPFEERELLTAIEMALYKFQAENKLKTSERWLSTTLRSIGDAVIATDVNGCITFMNTIAELLTGFTQSEAEGRELEEIFHIINEYTRQIIEHPAARVLREGVIVGLANHTILISKEGKETPIDDSASPIRDDNGHITGVVLVFRDITERKQAEKKILQSAETSRNIIELSPYAIIVHRYGKVLYCNQKAVETFGAKDKSEIIGASPLSFIHPDDRELAMQRVKYMMETGNPVPLAEERVLRADGSVIDCEIAAGTFMYDGEPAIQTIARDISERKQSLQAIKESEEKYRITFENTGTSTQIIEEDLTISLVNSEFEILSGYSKEEIEGKMKFTHFIIREDVERLRKYHNARRINPSSAPGHYEYSFIDRWGNIKNVINTVAIIPGTKKSIASLIDITGRKKVEEALKSNQKKTQAIINAIPDLLFIINKDFIFVDVKSEDTTKLLVPPEKIIGKSVDEILDHDVAELTKKYTRLALETKDVQIFEYDFPFNGEILHEEARIVAYSDMEVLAIVRDISERVKAKEDLRRSESLFRLVWENSADGMCMLDLKGIVQKVNAAFCKIFEIGLDDLIGRPFVDVYKLEFRDGLLARHIERFREGNISTNFQQEITLWNNKKIWIDVSSSLLEPEGEKPLLIGIFHDITETKKAEESLKRLNECFLSFGPDARKNIQSIVTFVGEQLEATCAAYNILEDEKLITVASWNTPDDFKTEDEAVGHICYDVIRGKFDGACVIRNLPGTVYHASDLNVSKYGLKTYIGKSVSVENQPVGSICVVYRADYVPTEDDLNLLGIAASAIGVEEKRLQADAELRIAKETAEKADKLKTDFLAQMSHEIRTPINTILSFTSLLKEELEGKLQEDLASSFKIIDNGGRRLTRTIDMILTMSQLQSGNYELIPKNLNVFDDILEGLYKEFSNVTITKGLDFNLFKKTENAGVYADTYTLTQLFQNLIDNAIKYTKKGKVEIIVYRNTLENLCVDIIDTGIGISKDYLPSIFSPFSQEETGYTRRFEGNGLGLALVKKYAELNNAVVSVDSEKGKGSVFTVTF